MGSGVVVIKDDFKLIIKRFGIIADGDSKKKLYKKLLPQMLSDNLRLFDSEQYANEKGNIKKWKRFKTRTLYYYIKRGWGWGHSRKEVGKAPGTMVWNKRPSGRRYNRSSKLLRDDGALFNSLGSVSGKGVRIINTKYVEYGSKLKYASRQNSMRPIVGIAKNTINKIQRITMDYIKNGRLKI